MFENIIGHKKEKNILESQIKKNSFSHAYLFSGPDGIGKKILAENFAKEIIKNGLINHDRNVTLNHPDLFFYGYDEEPISIKSIRQLSEETITRPLEGKNRVFIIDHADKMNVYAQNALLKTLEEPNPGNIIILVSSNPNALLSTIKSRCQELIFHDLDLKDKKDLLENLHIDSSKVDLQETPGKIISFNNDSEKSEKFKKFKDDFYQIYNGDSYAIFDLAEILSKDKEESKQLIEYLIRDLYKGILKNSYPNKKTINSISILIDLLDKLSYNVNLRLQWESSLFKIFMEQ